MHIYNVLLRYGLKYRWTNIKININAYIHIYNAHNIFVIHMDQDLSVWFTKSVWVCISWWQKKDMALNHYT